MKSGSTAKSAVFGSLQFRRGVRELRNAGHDHSALDYRSRRPGTQRCPWRAP